MATPDRVLVVDAGEAAGILEAAGFAVRAVGAADAAAAGAGRPDVIVLDVEGGAGHGLDLARRLQSEPATASIPLLLLSANVRGLAGRLTAERADVWLSKPYEPAELASAVRSLARRRDAETALETRDSLLAIAGAVTGTLGTTETLRLVCRELARLTGAETVGAHLLDRERDVLQAVAGYHIPKDALPVLSASAVSRQPFWPAVISAGEVVWSDDVAGDPRFEFPLFREVPHRSGVVIPLVVDGEVAGTFYLVWWRARRRVEPAEAMLLQTIGRQVGLLLRNARLIEEAEVRRRLAEAAKAHYQLLFERNLAGVFRMTRQGRVIECNEAFARLVGHRAPEDTVPHSAWDFYADPGERDRLLARLDGERRVTNQEVRWRRRGGEEFTVIMNATALGEGRDAQIEGIVLDISERKRAEDALRARETQLRHLGDNLPDGVIYQVVRRLDGSNYFAYMSSGLERTFGLRASEALTQPDAVYRMVLPEDLAKIRAAADDSIRTGEPMDVEYRMRTPAGEIRWLNLRGRPSRLADGATQWDVVALDVTGRKRAEERYRLLFERSFVGIFRTRPDGIVLECNDAFARILGYAGAADMRGRSVVGHYASEADREAVVARIVAGEDVIDAQLTGRRRDGSLVPVAMSARRIVDHDGPVHEGVLVDLTNRKSAEEAETLRSVAALANAAAHEINNPLTAIFAHLDRVPAADPADAARLEQVRAAAARIRDIVSDMTQITRLEPSRDWPFGLPRMLDIRRSGAGRPDQDEDVSGGAR
jgi:PAS domain S-box-containing protein